MGNLRQSPNRFFYKHRDKGVPNLMLWIMVANVVVYLVNMTDPSQMLLSLLEFDRAKILRGEVWRMFTFIFLELSSLQIIWALIAAMFYYQIGRVLEYVWGRFRFNCYYLTGLLMMIIAGFLFGYASVDSLHNTLFLAYATLYPNEIFRIYFIIPIKARWLALVTLVLELVTLLQFRVFPLNLFPVFALANYFLYFGKNFLNVFPDSWRVNARQLFRKKNRSPKSVPFSVPGSSREATSRPKGPYARQCAVCGRTDVSHPDLEFRFCSRCRGYHCYCIDHINDHTHTE